MLLKGTWRPDHPSQPQEFCLRTTIGCWERSKFILLKRRALFFRRREKTAEKPNSGQQRQWFFLEGGLIYFEEDGTMF